MRSSGYIRPLLAVCIASLAALAGCGSSSSSSTSSQAKQGSSAGALAGKTLTIGNTAALSGPYAIYGQERKTADELAIQDVGSVLGAKLSLSALDQQIDTTKAIANAQQLMGTDHVSLMLGAEASVNGFAVAKQAQTFKTLFISAPTDDDAWVTQECSPYVFKMTPVETMRDSVGAAYVVNHLGKDVYGIGADIQYGHEALAIYQSAAEAHGKWLGAGFVPVDATDFSGVAHRAISSGANVIVSAFVGADLTQLVTQLRSFGYKGPIFHTTLVDAQIAAAKPTTFPNDYSVIDWDWTLNARTRAFAQRFKKLTRGYPSGVGASEYDAIVQWAAAVERAGTTDPLKVAAALAGHTYTGVYTTGGTFNAKTHLMAGQVMVAKVVPSPSVPGAYWDILQTVRGSQLQYPPHTCTASSGG